MSPCCSEPAQLQPMIETVLLLHVIAAAHAKTQQNYSYGKEQLQRTSLIANLNGTFSITSTFIEQHS